uniref:Cell division protein FtsX n=1 Tax=Magnetococcus massalia (strain MO-1) TaxID=451514 RepID=A0A1S7LM38_MAGMO|nr:Cell division protein FtsX [Candidatus Magnetococcus massalia]
MNRPTRSAPAANRSRGATRRRTPAATPPPNPEEQRPPLRTNYSGGFHQRAMRQAWRQFRTGSMVHWTTIVVIALALTIYGVFALLLNNASLILEQWRGDNLIAVFMDVHATQNQLDYVHGQLSAHPGITELNHVSPNQALTRMKALLGTEAGLLSGLEENPLPYSLEFTLQPGYEQQSSQIAQAATNWPGVDAVTYNRQWVERLDAVLQAVRLGGNALSFLLLVAVAFIISNTLKLTIVARRDEIEVMRFVGATDAFIKTPFIYEGILQGILGALASMLMIFLFYFIAAQAISDFGHSFGFTLVLVPLPWYQMLFIITMGIFLGIMGALLSTIRFLKI